MNKKISAIIPASGNGSRLGIPKIRASINGKLFIDLILEKIKIFSDFVFVINNTDLEFVKTFIPEQNIIVNKNPELGMIHSIELGLYNLNETDGYLIYPIDHPLVNIQTILSLIETFELNPNSIIKPSYQNKSGHPIIIPQSLRELILKNNSRLSLNELIKLTTINNIYVNVDDLFILKNLNTPEDFEISENF